MPDHIMNAFEALGLFSNADKKLAQHLEKLPAKQKRTAKGVLESSVKLEYVMFAMGDTRAASELVEPISQIPFANSYDCWTWIEAALVMKGRLAIALGHNEEYDEAFRAAVAALKSGSELQMTVKENVHKRFMDGQTLDMAFEDEENFVDEFEMRLSYVTALMKIEFFGCSETWTGSRIESELLSNIARMNDIIVAKGIYKLAPYK